MRRWNRQGVIEKENPKIDAFIEDVIEVCRAHGFSISHEDGHGAFLIEPFNADLAEWLRCAYDDTDETPPGERRR